MMVGQGACLAERGADTDIAELAEAAEGAQRWQADSGEQNAVSVRGAKEAWESGRRSTD